MQTIIRKTNKDLFYIKTKYDTEGYYVVNPVNTVGIMGKGLAKQFKDAYPSHFLVYKEALSSGDLDIGKVYIDRINKIIDFPTKKHWRGRSKIEFIEKGLIDLRNQAESSGIKVIAFPKIGSGLGGLDYESKVKPLIIKTFADSKLEKVFLSEWAMKK